MARLASTLKWAGNEQQAPVLVVSQTAAFHQAALGPAEGDAELPTVIKGIMPQRGPSAGRSAAQPGNLQRALPNTQAALPLD